MNLNCKKIIVTGAGSGIGYEIVRQLLQMDCTIIAVDRKFSENFPNSVNVQQYICDISYPDNIDKLFSFALTVMGSIDVFIANAGFAYYEKITSADWQHIENIFNTNVFSPLYSAQKLKELSGDRTFAFVATSSAMAHWPLAGYALYSGTKSAIMNFADAYRFELSKRQSFHVVYPVATRTSFFENAGSSPHHYFSQSPQLVAKRIIDGIQRGKNSIFPSRVYCLLHTLNRFFPVIERVIKLIEKRKFNTWLEQRSSASNSSFTQLPLSNRDRLSEG